MEITPDALIRVLASPQGGSKNIPPAARRIAFLNQAESPELLSIAGAMAARLSEHFDSVVVGSLKFDQFQTFENTAGILLAAGESKRFGALKQLLEWRGKPFVRQVAEAALHAELRPVVVVLGHRAAEIESALSGLPVQVVHNEEYRTGQSTSIRKGLEALPSHAGSAVFLLADQPQISSEVLKALAEAHRRELPAILAPLVLEERRANPVLFDRAAFPDLLQLTGDIGGRAVFDKYRVEYLPWHDDILLLDVDDPQDYQRLKELE
jgi:molybdenum cofactor cytidylyltransferase